jgi:hypothetical protein
VSFATITLCVASQRVFIIVSIYIFIDSVRKLLVTPSYSVHHKVCVTECEQVQSDNKIRAYELYFSALRR